MRRAELQKAVEGRGRAWKGVEGRGRRGRTWKGVECSRRTVESENGIPFISQHKEYVHIWSG